MVNNWVASIVCMIVVVPCCLVCLSLFIFFPWFATDLYPEYAKYTEYGDKQCRVTGYYMEETTECVLTATAADYPVDTQFDCSTTYIPYLNTTFGIGLIRKEETRGGSKYSNLENAIEWQSTHNIGDTTQCYYKDDDRAIFTELDDADIFIILETIFAGILTLALCGCAVVVLFLGCVVCLVYVIKDRRKIARRLPSSVSVLSRGAENIGE